MREGTRERRASRRVGLSSCRSARLEGRLGRRAKLSSSVRMGRSPRRLEVVGQFLAPFSLWPFLAVRLLTSLDVQGLYRLQEAQDALLFGGGSSLQGSLFFPSPSLSRDLHGMLTPRTLDQTAMQVDQPGVHI